MSERRTDYPHVTDLIRDAGLVDVAWMTDYARDRGTAVHLATALLHEDDLDEESLDPAVAAYLPAYRKFLEDVHPTEVECEVELVNRQLGYCGTADRLWRVYRMPTLTDVKTGAPDPWHRLQTAGYAGCYLYPVQRSALYLHDDGTYRYVPHRDRGDWPVFKAVRLLAQWRQLNA